MNTAEVVTAGLYLHHDTKDRQGKQEVCIKSPLACLLFMLLEAEAARMVFVVANQQPVFPFAILERAIFTLGRSLTSAGSLRETQQKLPDGREAGREEIPQGHSHSQAHRKS